MAARPGVLSLSCDRPRADGPHQGGPPPSPRSASLRRRLVDHATANQRAAATVAAVRKFIARALPYFGAMRLDQIGAAEVTAWTRQLQDAGLSPGSLGVLPLAPQVGRLAIAREYYPTLGPAPRIEVAKAPAAGGGHPDCRRRSLG
jgi:hypothetical protein